MKEIAIWRHLKHDNIASFIGVLLHKKRSYCLVSEWMDNGTVMAYLRSHATISRIPLVRLSWTSGNGLIVYSVMQMLDVANGLMYMHKLDLVHCNMKSVCSFFQNSLRKPHITSSLLPG
jgi:serine/threonine protein kinase